MNESHSILQRMRELAVQSANDTNTDSDRAEMQKEVDQLAQALTDISEDTEFNTKNLLNGDFKGTFQVGANEGQNLSIEIGNMSAEELEAGFSTESLGESGGDAVEVGTYSVVSFGEDGEATGLSGVSTAKFGLQDSDGDIVAVSSDGQDYQQLNSGVSVDSLDTASSGSAGNISFTEDVKNGTVTVTSGGSSSIDLKATGGINVSTQETADLAITTIQSAIDSVSAERSKLGAVQNRLDHTINNLGTSAENLTAAESRIRDVDMAKEMMNFTKNNILSQAAQSMLAQANQQPQGVLQLLR